MRLLLENLNGVIALVGFLALEAGTVMLRGWPMALVIAGAMLIFLATAPYVWWKAKRD